MADIIPFRPRQQRPAAPDTRTRIEGALALALDAVDQLVAVLDDIEGDPDREDGGDTEPCLAALETRGSQVFWMRGGDRDLEAE